MKSQFTLNRLQRRTTAEPVYAAPKGSLTPTNGRNAKKPARITRAQLAAVIVLLENVANGQVSKVKAEAAAMLPLLRGSVTAAPRGPAAARVWYTVALPNGSTHTLHGIKAAAAMIGRTPGTLMNALSKGAGAATFAAVDENGNPALTTVKKAKQDPCQID